MPVIVNENYFSSSTDTQVGRWRRRGLKFNQACMIATFTSQETRVTRKHAQTKTSFITIALPPLSPLLATRKKNALTSARARLHIQKRHSLQLEIWHFLATTQPVNFFYIHHRKKNRLKGQSRAFQCSHMKSRWLLDFCSLIILIIVTALYFIQGEHSQVWESKRFRLLNYQKEHKKRSRH